MSRKADNQKWLSIYQQTWLVWAVYALSFAILAVLVFSPRGWVFVNRIQEIPYHETITLLRPWFKMCLFLTALFCFVMLCRVISCRKHISLRIFNVILIVLFLLSTFYRFMPNPLTWMIYDRAMGPDNNNYYYMAWSFMMGGESVLSRLKSKTLFSETFEVLQIHFKDTSKWRRMVRPTEFIDDNHLRLYISKSGYIVGMVANKCCVAYDFKSKHSFGDSNIGELSPFVLINSNTLMNQDDVRDVISDMKETCLAGKKVYYPSSRYIGRPMLEKSLKHPNVEVRKLAKQLLDILIEHEK